MNQAHPLAVVGRLLSPAAQQSATPNLQAGYGGFDVP
jgi:hypothetical protein